MSPPVGVVAEFARAEEMLAALRAGRIAGWRRIEAHGPYPVPEAAEILGTRTWPIAAIAVVAGLLGGGLQYGAQWYLTVVDYPINVGGRPLHAWPVFLPAAYIVAVLWAAVAAALGMLWLNGLPRLHHPVFAAPGFARAMEDRFLVCILLDPAEDADAAEALLRAQTGALRVSRLSEEEPIGTHQAEAR
jgi:hypothetical protein